MIAPAPENVRQCVFEHIVDLGRGERWVRGEAATPSQRVVFGPIVAVQIIEVAAPDLAAGARSRVLAREAHELDVLAPGDPESPFAAVPISREHHGVPLTDMEDAVGVEAGTDG